MKKKIDPKSYNYQYAHTILFALQRLGKHVYEGTAPFDPKRQKRNKTAKLSRKINRP